MIKTLLKNKKFRFNLIAMSLVLLEMHLFQTYAPYMILVSILLSVITGAIGIALNGSIYFLYSFYKWSKKPIKINETEIDFGKRMLKRKRGESLKNLLD